MQFGSGCHHGHPMAATYSKINMISGDGSVYKPMYWPQWKQETRASKQSLTATRLWNHDPWQHSKPRHHHDPGRQHKSFWLAWSLLGHIPWTLTWSQVVFQTPWVHKSLDGNRNHNYKHKPPLLHQGHWPRYGPRQETRPNHYYGPRWQSGHPFQPIPQHPHLFWLTSLSTTYTVLASTFSHFPTLYLNSMMAPDTPVPQIEYNWHWVNRLIFF